MPAGIHQKVYLRGVSSDPAVQYQAYILVPT
jgi:hypothetical protein